MNHATPQPTACTVRPAAPSDAGEILAIYGQGFPERLRPLTALGCQGAAVYVEGLIREAERSGANRFWVATLRGEGGIAGFVQWRLFRGRAVLNNIYVRHRDQGQGVGARLIAASLADLAWPCDALELDVFTTNERARRWYERIGFSTFEHRTWWLGEQEQPAGAASTAAEPYVVSGTPQADAVHRALGFSQLEITTPLGEYAIGRLGDHTFRLPGTAALEDAALLAALARLDARRRLFLIAPSGDLPRRPAGPSFERLATAERMRAAPADVIDSLKDLAS